MEQPKELIRLLFLKLSIEQNSRIKLKSQNIWSICVAFWQRNI